MANAQLEGLQTRGVINVTGKESCAKSSTLFTQSTKVGVSNRRCAARGKILRCLLAIMLRSCQTVSLHDLAKTSCNVTYAKHVWHQRLVRRVRCIHVSQTCEETVLAQSWYYYERDGCMGMRSAGSTDPRKIHGYAQILLSVVNMFPKYLHLVPVRQRVALPSPRLFDPYFTAKIHAAPYGYVQISARNF